MSEDLAHDAHLRAALRHAPDHALSPPSGLSQTILAAARQAHRPLRPTPAPPPMRWRATRMPSLRAWLRRLFAPRWAGAWAASLVAALGLGLWFDLGLQPMVERPSAVAMNSTRSEAPGNAPAAPATKSRVESAVDPLRMTQAEAPLPAQMAEIQRRVAPHEEPRVSEGPSTQRREIAAGDARQRGAEIASGDAGAAPQPTTPPAVATAPASNSVSDATAKAAEGVAAARAAPPAAPGVAPHDEPPSSARSETSLRAALPDARVAGARRSDLVEAVAAASPALTLLRRVQGDLASRSTTWLWVTPGGVAMVPFDAAGQAWLSRAAQLTRGRWVDVSERGESPDTLEVRWWRDGWPQATLRIEAAGLRWIEPGGRIRYAPLDAAALQGLRTF